MTMIKHKSKMLLAKIPAQGTFTAVDIDTTGILERPEALGSALRAMANDKLIKRCGSQPIKYLTGGRRAVYEITDLGRRHKQKLGGIKGR